MEKVLNFFRNKWLKFGVSFLTLGYPMFLGFVAWLAFAYYLVPTNPTSLFALYLFINVIFAAVMIYTRRQFVTQLVACISPIIAFAILIVGFGQWYLVAPPVITVLVVFFAVATSETIKTVLGTIYLLLFVVGSLAYLTLLYFNLDLNTLLSDTSYDMSLRSDDVEYSTKGTYRLVRYIDDESKERRTVTYCVEQTKDDMKLWFLDCYCTYGAKRVLVTVYTNNTNYKWVSDNQLLIDGKIRKISFDDNADEDLSGETAVRTTAAATSSPEKSTDTAE